MLLFVGGMASGCADASAPETTSSVAVPTVDQSTGSIGSVASPAPPLALGGAERDTASLPVEMSIADARILPAVNLHRFKSNLPPGDDLRAGADLNGDGVAEALVLMTTPDCLAGAGCPLVVFEQTNVGYRPFSVTQGVRPPIAVAAGNSMGWRHLLAAGPQNLVYRLVMTETGYPPLVISGETAALQPPIEVLIGKGDPSLSNNADGGWSMHVAAELGSPGTLTQAVPTSTAKLP